MITGQALILTTTIGGGGGGGSSPNFAQETPAGTIDGSNVTFTLGHAPSPATSLQLVQNTGQGGVVLIAVTNYTLSGLTLTLLVPPAIGDTLYAWYRF